MLLCKRHGNKKKTKESNTELKEIGDFYNLRSQITQNDRVLQKRNAYNKNQLLCLVMILIDLAMKPVLHRCYII